MASYKSRMFLYDWEEEKYVLNYEGDFLKPMDWKSDENVCNFEKTIKFDRELRGDIDGKKCLNEDNLKKETKGMDIVDAAIKKMQNRSENFLYEISKGHQMMMSVLSNRLLRLTAAQTLWYKDMNSFMEYILRLDDDAVMTDILPILSKRVKADGPDLSTLSMGACLDLLPVLEKLLNSKYEDYIIASIDMIREIMKRWWKQLQMMGKKEEEELNSDLQCSRSVRGVYILLIAMNHRIEALASRSGKIGEKSKVLQQLLALL
ncbi:KATNB1-like protein 1 [Xenia sp. Carnegie-2017]|uniref:KATNB1-like protein 1 n=1 Tax=Xenia sp. Carnegie-2017 TaxID=2897299 RepID=UPI001F0467F2|nr:KATNB1-like protein 1 [Xenia sp. Carnegie-2017]